MTVAAPVASNIMREHLERIRAFYDRAPTELNAAARGYRDQLAHYYNLLIPPDASVLEIGCGSGGLLARVHAARKVGVDLSPVQIAAARRRVPEADFHVQAGESLDLDERFDYVIISDTLNFAADVQQLLEQLHRVAHADTRLILNYHSLLWRPVLAFAQVSGVKSRQPQSSWLDSADVDNLLRLADWTPIVRQARLLCPVNCAGLDAVLNRWLAPLCGWFCFTVFCVARSSRARRPRPGTVSVVIPARNESGNIPGTVARIPEMGAGTEIIFVEDHSTDGTWAQIECTMRDHPDRNVRILRQTGERGKGNAVRRGFAAATGDILMILDADLTVPPEELPKFYDAIATDRAEFANGVRLVYPMDDKAMQFLNAVANKLFGLAFTWLLGQPIKDTLCGTKVLRREHYEKIAAGRAYFGSLDPFGDFDLLFGAARLQLKIADVPIRYRERTYGTTNIRRWRHGWLLLRMVALGARKLKFV